MPDPLALHRVGELLALVFLTLQLLLLIQGAAMVLAKDQWTTAMRGRQEKPYADRGGPRHSPYL